MGIVKGSECLKIRQLIQMAEQQTWGYNFGQTVSKVLAVGRKVMSTAHLYCVDIQVFKWLGQISRLKNLISNLGHTILSLFHLSIPNFIKQKSVCTSEWKWDQVYPHNGLFFRNGEKIFTAIFLPRRTRKDIMEMCWHGRTGVETDQDRVSGEKQGSGCWHKQQECPASATRKVCHLSRSPTILPQDPFELC